MLNAQTDLPFHLLKIYEHLVMDVEQIMGLDEGILFGDFQRIATSVKSRGLTVLLVDLPEICSAFDKALDIGWWKGISGVAFVKKGVPTIFQPLFRMLFTDNWVLRDEPSVECMRCLRTLLKVFKKYNIDCPQSAKEKAIGQFKAIETELRHPTFNWGDTHLTGLRSAFPHLTDVVWHFASLDEHEHGGSSRECYDEELLLDLSNIQWIADRILKGFCFQRNRFNPKHGPGAVSDKFGKSKFEFPNWPVRLEKFFPECDYGLPSHQIWNSEPSSCHNNVASKVILVPKSYKGPRVIASEPIANQYIQQGIRRDLLSNIESSVLRRSISLNDQVPSQEGALSASLDGQFSTIDLSSASDRLSCYVVERLFRSNISYLEILNSARTHFCDVDGDVIELKKFAAQGAAFTFPVQSIAYAIICMGVVFSCSRMTRLADLANVVRVYGDDMIVPTYAYRRICKVLTALQLVVNPEKSFSEGFFRESCGMDAYLGTDITPVSINCVFDMRVPESLVSVVQCSNNLFYKGFINASRLLLETIPTKFRKDIPIVTSGSTVLGIVSGGRFNGRTRWNKQLHRIEARVITVNDRVNRTSVDGQHRLFQWFIENPRPDVIWAPGEVYAVKARYRPCWVPLELF